MVAGDLVNTASRLQSVAPPGVVLVGESTRRAAERASRSSRRRADPQGQAAPVPVPGCGCAERGGANRSGHEAPFVGRDDELRLLKDFFHATGRERQPRLISVTGQAGIGRAASWDFLKYIDGVWKTTMARGPSPHSRGRTFWAWPRWSGGAPASPSATTEATTRHAWRDAPGVRAGSGRARAPGARPPALLGVGDAATGRRESSSRPGARSFERVAADHPGSSCSTTPVGGIPG